MEMNVYKRIINRVRIALFPTLQERWLRRRRDELFTNGNKSKYASEFMTFTYDVNPQWIEKIFAVVHVDNTVRPQVVRNDLDSRYWKLIEEVMR